MSRRAALVAAFLLLVSGAAPAQTVEARAVVEETITAVLSILSQAELPVERRVEEIEAVTYRAFDFAVISRLVLARGYRQFSPEQRVEFEAEFKRYLSRSYSNRVDRYEQEKVAFLGEREEKRGDVTVKTRIVGGQADGIDVDYRLRQQKETGDWKVIDVVIEGVSLVANYRSQFKEIVNQGGPGELLERLKNKNIEVRSSEEATAGD